MAKLTTFFQDRRASSEHPTEVECGWQVIDTPPNCRLLQLSTFGSEARLGERKVSQTIQLDEARARDLMEIMRRTFNF
jgi:hypothetical protein